ncbi:MAG: hypothetical protein AAF573_06245 [Bacteroidota bacterium]
MSSPSSSQFLFWVKYLKAVSIFFALMGVMWAVLGSFDPFGWYDTAFARSFWNSDQLPADAKKATQFILGPFGATSAGYFILQYFIAANAYAKKELWGFYAIICAFLFWLFLDTTMSIYHRAYFNIYFANIPSLIAMTPIFLTRKYFSRN